MTDARVRWITVALLAALVLYAFSQFELTQSITHFIPSRDEAELVELSLELVDSPLARRMVLAVGGGPERARVAAELADSLQSHPEVTWVEAGFDDDFLQAIYELYFDRRVYLVSDTPTAEITRLLGAGALAGRGARMRERLAQPGSILVSRTAPDDPLGLFDRIIERIRSAQPARSSGRGGFESLDGRYAIVQLGLRSSPFETEKQAALLRDIEREFELLNAGGGLELEQSGVNRIALASEQSVRGDVNFISAVSISVVCTLFLLVFRSLRYLAIAILTPLSGFVAALAVALSSGPVHGITLGFGCVLVGVAIDYPIHVMNHHALAPSGTRPREIVGRIRSSLLLSGLTTTLAFIALALSDFPGLEEMGTFAAIGVPTALAVTLYSVPAFMRASASPTPTQRALSRGSARLVDWLAAHRGLVAAFFIGYVTIAAVGLPQLRWEDDPATLIVIPESERVRPRILAVDGGRFVVGLAPDAESALSLNDRIYGRLERAISAGQLEGVNSLHTFLWSQALQSENLEALRSVPDLGDRIDRAYSLSGFRPDAFRGFDAAIAAPDAAPLRPDDFAGSPLERILDSLVELDGRWAVVTYLRGVTDSEAIRAALSDLPGAHYVDQGEIVADVYQRYRRSTVRIIAIGCAIAFAVLQLRYRSLRRGLLAFVSSALPALATYGLFGLMGYPVNVVSAVSLLAVLGMGVDYGVFTVDGARHPERLGATLSSLFVSCFTSVFVFGTLALSEQPVLRSIGLTTGVGILLALALSPAIFVLARRT